ncbi:hypothetical protein [Flavobacterium piscis]|uniref:Uncharacterized protein n=1 Tax=Flavobacterium piscis TaxID=1114874 RepID=A0ABU1Y6K1_9FLAO|nr:hypothetical protein [Flavobacterium piscis]MDR7209141.1 hypothetical protein [Flavobacterium piscis]
MDEIYQIETLDGLENYLVQFETDKIRESLYTEFLKYSDYKNVTEWNKAVRLCESLTIIGWGEKEPVEAKKGMFYNGNPETTFYNKDRQSRYVSAIWSSRTTGFTMEQGRTDYHESPDVPAKQTILWDYPTVEEIQNLKLENQKNWIPKNPILITQGISNCYENSQKLIDGIKNELQPKLDSEMQIEKYGKSINRIVFVLSMSYYDNNSCKTNYIIADENLKLKQKDFYPALLKMFTKKEIADNGYFLRNRYDYGNFQSNTGIIKTEIKFEKEFSEMSYEDQKAKLTEYISTALLNITDKLKKKKLQYDFDLMLEDFRKIVSDWK